MAVFYEIKDRRVIPNWRDYKRTIQLGELASCGIQKPSLDINIDRAINDWRANKSVGVAADILNSAFISGKYKIPELDEALDYIYENQDKSSQSLLSLCGLIRDRNSDFEEENENSILDPHVDSIIDFSDSDRINKSINEAKRSTISQLHNPIAWVELSRLYSIKGNNQKAGRAMDVALHLAPDNRFVLRSATRYFAHNDQFDKALFYLKRSSGILSDPWLISAHIATSQIVSKFSPFIKIGKSMVDSGDYSDFDLTEVASSLGTLELESGSFKKYKRFFKKSMLCPNDNTLAQLEWASSRDKRLEVDPRHFKEVLNPFEAYAFELYDLGKWKESLQNSIYWFLDMPFSKRPIFLASHIAGTFLEDRKTAFNLYKIGLEANPYDPTLLNNAVYSALMSDENIDIDIYLKRISELNFNSLNSSNKITIQATLGLLAIKNGDIDTGIDYYETAIINAKSINNHYLAKLAILNLARELNKHNLPEKDSYINKVENMKISSEPKDLIILHKRVLNEIRERN